MNVVVTPPLTAGERGSISCRPVGEEPITLDWSGSSVTLDESGCEASEVSVGRYCIRAIDSNGDRADAIVDVEPSFENAIVVNEYVVTPPNTRHSRDGEVVAVCSGADGANVRFLWTTGVETDTPRLSDVSCGTYAIVAVARSAEATEAPVTVHVCPPAKVRVAA